MTDQARTDRKDENESPRKDDLRNGGGDERGAPRRAGPSTRTVDEGLEGAILDPDERPPNKPTGAGTEAAEGMHGASSDGAARDVRDASPAAGQKAETDDSRKKGSEPLEHRDTTHSSSYGGEMGEPRSAE